MTAPQLILPLGACAGSGLAEVGGKSVNLDALLRAGFPVPAGFVVTTAAYAAAAERAGLGDLIDRLGSLSEADPHGFRDITDAMRGALQAVDAGEQLTADIRAAYAKLGHDTIVAVRSSATAEDLADASFAGQQDSFLDVRGEGAVIMAIKACWASLWTERAVFYRARAGIDPKTVKLAVVVQVMVPARAAGVMFTADPVTGSRRQMVIDVAPGRGEMVVAGHDDVDHYVVERKTAQVLSYRGAKRTGAVGEVIGGAELEELVRMGGRIEESFGVPQDIEFVFDTDSLWITQTRAITTLFPIPPARVGDAVGLRVYFSATADEGVVRPITPMGLQAFRIMAGAAADIFWGLAPKDRLAGPWFMVEAGMRAFYDITVLIRSMTARRLIRPFISAFDEHTAAILDLLYRNPELAPKKDSLWRVAPVALRPLWRFPFISGIGRALIAPQRARARSANLLQAILNQSRPVPESPKALLERVDGLLWSGVAAIPEMAFLEPMAGFVAFALAKKMLGKSLSETEGQVLLSGLSNSTTVALNIDLWTLSRLVVADSASYQSLRDGRPEELRDAFQAGHLPPALMTGLANYLDLHGHRAVFEVDLGLPRWSEDPAHLLTSLKNYLREDADRLNPTSMHARSVATAMSTRTAVLARVGPLRRRIVRALLGRARSLWVYREQWKDDLSRIWAAARHLLGEIGETLAAAGRLEAAQDIYFLSLREVGDLLESSSTDARPLVQARRATYDAELKRRQVPAVLLSDGTDASRLVPSDTAADLFGIGASPGVARGRARVLREPVGATIEPGEILVAPSTDPGWTPLFMTAAGLVMEKGAPMCHGAVIAREFGIPAVVSVSGATDRIWTGQMLEIDGVSGLISLIDPTPQNAVGV